MLEIVVHTNNSIEYKNWDFKYEYLRHCIDNSVSIRYIWYVYNV